MEEFIRRREKLSAQLQCNSVMILQGAGLQFRNGDVEFPFRQNSNFYYLTGFSEPDAVMVLMKNQNGLSKYILFNRASDPEAEIWSGKRIGLESACKDYGVDESYDVNDIDDILPTMFFNAQVIYFPLGYTTEHDKQIISWLKIARNILKKKKYREQQKVPTVPDSLQDIMPYIYELRLFKSEQEIAHMRRAANISAQAHVELMRICKAGMFEYQLESTFNHYCLNNGCRSLAYNSIVASGENTCILHYTKNDQILKNGDLLLVDAGAEYNYYAADITRTFPVSGRFTDEQRQIYALVLQAQLAGIQEVRPGNTWNRVQEVMVQIIVSGLVRLGIMQGDVDCIIQKKEFKKFYMHSSGHWLGLDVHDVGKYKINHAWRKFEPGMVLTVEPGIYINQNISDVDKKWLGIGVRIEDDILVTQYGHEILSGNAPKEIAEIERTKI